MVEIVGQWRTARLRSVLSHLLSATLFLTLRFVPQAPLNIVAEVNASNELKESRCESYLKGPLDTMPIR
jgi:hypothetical protein